MLALEPVTLFVPITRIREGRRVVAELMVSLDWPNGLTRLTIGDDWSIRQQDFRRLVTFALVEDEPGVWRLVRDSESVDRDPDGITHYNVRLDGRATVCDCRGGYATERANHQCKHAVAMLAVQKEGLL